MLEYILRHIEDIVQVDETFLDFNLSDILASTNHYKIIFRRIIVTCFPASASGASGAYLLVISTHIDYRFYLPFPSISPYKSHLRIILKRVNKEGKILRVRLESA